MITITITINIIIIIISIIRLIVFLALLLTLHLLLISNERTLLLQAWPTARVDISQGLEEHSKHELLNLYILVHYTTLVN